MIRVLIAEDVTDVRETLVVLLGLEDDIEVAAAVAAGGQILPAALACRPDVALLDAGLPETDGITVAGLLARRLPGCGVLILTGRDSPDSLAAALGAGVRGYLLKDRPGDELVAAVRAVARGEQIIDPRLGSQLPDPRQGPSAPS